MEATRARRARGRPKDRRAFRAALQASRRARPPVLALRYVPAASRLRCACVARAWAEALRDAAPWQGLRISGREVFALRTPELVSLGRILRALRPEMTGELQLKAYAYPAQPPVAVDVFEFIDVEETNAAESGMKVWTTAQAAAQLFARWPQVLVGNVVELGAGLGTVGAVCGQLASGRVVCTDTHDPDHPHVLRFLDANLRLNCAARQVLAAELSWGAAAARAVAERHGPFQTILGFDVVYSDAVDLLAESIAELLAIAPPEPPPLALVGFCERFAEREERFAEKAIAYGLRVDEVAWSTLLVDAGSDIDFEEVPPALRARLTEGGRPPRAAKSLWLKLLLRYLGLRLLVISRD